MSLPIIAISFSVSIIVIKCWGSRGAVAPIGEISIPAPSEIVGSGGSNNANFFDQFQLLN